MGTLKKSKALFKKKAEEGGDYKSRQGNYPAEETKSKSSAGEGPSKDYKERQGHATETKSPPNKFPEANAPEKKAQTFGEAFKAGRSSGAKTFTWNGKSYTTELKGATPAAKPTTPAAKPAAKPTAPATPAKKPTSLEAWSKAGQVPSKTADLVKKATGKQVVERSDTRHPNYKATPIGYKSPGTLAKSKPGTGAPLKSYPSTQKCGGKTKKK